MRPSRFRRDHVDLDRLLLVLLAEQLVHTHALLLEMLMPAGTRIWRRLAELADAYVDGTIHMSQDELALIAGTGRQTANRVLRVGVRHGVLAIDRGAVQVIDRVALDRLAGRTDPARQSGYGGVIVSTVASNRSTSSRSV